MSLPLEDQGRASANREAFERLCTSEPVLVDVKPAIDVLPGMTANTVLVSGPPLPWDDYIGGQREAIIGGALFEELARDRADAESKLSTGEIVIGACHDYGCVGSLAGIYTASMPVFVVSNRAFGNTGYCNFYEGNARRRLNYGCYDDQVRNQLLFVQEHVAPVIGEAVRRSSGIPLKPIIRRALQMGDELHSRNSAATLLFTQALLPHLLSLPEDYKPGIRHTLDVVGGSDYFFLRLSMVAAKAIADAAAGITFSSVVTAMSFNCRGFAIRVSGLGATWFHGPHALVEAKLFEGHTEDEITWMGGESIIVETVGLGGFAQAAAFPLQRYQGGSPEAMIERNLAMYDITVGENTNFSIPYFSYRGTPTGIDVFRVVETGITPVMDVGIAGRGGGQIGAGVIRAPFECFAGAAEAYRETYPESARPLRAGVQPGVQR